jgi:hypothetical protein
MCFGLGWHWDLFTGLVSVPGNLDFGFTKDRMAMYV